MVGQRYLPTQPIDVFIAALNEEEELGFAFSELAENTYANRILVIDGHGHDGAVEVAKDREQKYFSKTAKAKVMPCPKRCSSWVWMLSMLLMNQGVRIS